MRHVRQRKSAPKVQFGSVQHKNNWTPRSRYHRPAGSAVAIYRERPGENYRHLLFQRDIEQFLALLPDWNELSQGLQAIVLAPGEPGRLGWHKPGVVAVCARERERVRQWNSSFFADHCTVLHSREKCARGEPFAEQYALRHADQLWDRYFATFGW